MGDREYLVLSSIKIWASWQSCTALQGRVTLPRVSVKDPMYEMYLHFWKEPLATSPRIQSGSRGSSSFCQLLKTPNWDEQP